MDASPFDEFTKTLTTGVSRRTILNALASAIAVGVVAVLLGASGVWAATDPPPPKHCYTPTADCPDFQVCLDPRYPLCGIVPNCSELGLILCGCGCSTPCVPADCADDEVCSPGGCCAPKPCERTNDCHGQPGDPDLAADRCIGGFCIRRGECTVPPE